MTWNLITGGCGFVGCNLAQSLLVDGGHVVVFDNLSRKGTQRNLEWLRSLDEPDFRFVQGDVRDFQALRKLFEDYHFDRVFHFAAQVAVTTSVENPREDFEVNALGTLNLLEVVRLSGQKPAVVFTSTNKVYGAMEDVRIADRGTCYDYEDLGHGVGEDQPLDFHSPYGCSKGTGDQYVRDYARIYDIPTIVFRMSCQYGPRQFGNEDQGWVAHFIIAAAKNRDINIYGDGKQVRDILYIDDLVAAFKAATRDLQRTRGRVYNIGGGRANTISLLELTAVLEEMHLRKIRLKFGDWRPGDQPVYISDIRRAEHEFLWKPEVSKYDGIRRMAEWVKQHQELFD